jgi:hypothetical protein
VEDQPDTCPDHVQEISLSLRNGRYVLALTPVTRVADCRQPVPASMRCTPTCNRSFAKAWACRS